MSFIKPLSITYSRFESQNQGKLTSAHFSVEYLYLEKKLNSKTSKEKIVNPVTIKKSFNYLIKPAN